jgi:hypothetical protein
VQCLLQRKYTDWFHLNLKDKWTKQLHFNKLKIHVHKILLLNCFENLFSKMVKIVNVILLLYMPNNIKKTTKRYMFKLCLIFMIPTKCAYWKNCLWRISSGVCTSLKCL